MQAQEVKSNPLGTAPINRLIAKYAIPAIISMLVGSLYNILDQLYIGLGAGTLGNAATNVSFPFSILGVSLSLLIGIGAASKYNLESGAGDQKRAKSIVGTGLTSLVISGFVLGVVILIFLDPLLYLFGTTESILPYAHTYAGINALGMPLFTLIIGGEHLIRADRSPVFSMIVGLSGVVLNTFLDPLFIFGFGWGIAGAAWSNLIGQAISTGLIIFYYCKKQRMGLKFRDLTPNFKEFREISVLGVGSFVNQIAMALIQMLINITLRRYGAESAYGAEVALACVGIISKVNMVFFAICIGVSQGCQPIWGFNSGAGNYKRVRETYRKAIFLCLGLGAVFLLIFQLFPEFIISIFGQTSPESRAFSTRYFRIFMMMTIVNGIQPISSGFFSSSGNAILGAILSLTRQVIFLAPLILLFPLIWGIDGIMYAGPIADAAAVVVALALARHSLRGMEKKALSTQ